MEDPTGRANAIKHLWAVERCVKAGELRPDKKIYHINPLSIQKGDLVDVAALVEAFTLRCQNGGRRIEVQLQPLHIIRLHSREFMMVRSPISPYSSNRLTCLQWYSY